MVDLEKCGFQKELKKLTPKDPNKFGYLKSKIDLFFIGVSYEQKEKQMVS